MRVAIAVYHVGPKQPPLISQVQEQSHMGGYSRRAGLTDLRTFAMSIRPEGQVNAPYVIAGSGSI